MLEVEHSDRSAVEGEYIPPTPRPQAQPLSPLELIRTLKRNPLECWAMQHFEQPIAAGGLPIGHTLLVHEPGAIRQILLENAANYRKDRLQRRAPANCFLFFFPGNRRKSPLPGRHANPGRQRIYELAHSIVAIPAGPCRHVKGMIRVLHVMERCVFAKPLHHRLKQL
jgi:hypothetical protein